MGAEGSCLSVGERYDEEDEDGGGGGGKVEEALDKGVGGRVDGTEGAIG